MLCDTTGVFVELDVLDKCWADAVRTSEFHTLTVNRLGKRGLGLFPSLQQSWTSRTRADQRPWHRLCVCDHMWTCISTS